jgi:hypothetical protein
MAKQGEKAGNKILKKLFFTGTGPFFYLVGRFLAIDKKTTTVDWVKKIYDAKFSVDIPLIIMILWISIWLFYIILSTKEESLNNEIEEYEKKYKEEQRLREYDAGLLLSEYDNLIDYKNKEVLFNIIRDFTLKNPLVHSAQIYKYSTKIHKKKVTSKIEYLIGYVDERIESNAIAQTYYTLDYKDYEDIITVIELYEKIYNIDIEESFELNELESLNNDFESLISEVLEKLSRDIRTNYESSELSEMDSIKFDILHLLLNLLIKVERKINESNEQSTFTSEVSPLISEEIDEKLALIKRNGIYCSLLLEGPYVNVHKGNNNKNGRVYIWDSIELDGVNHVISISLSTEEVLIANKGVNAYSHVNAIKDLLIKALEVEYNEVGS